MRGGVARFTYVRQQRPANRIECEPVGPAPDRDLYEGARVPRVEDGTVSLAAVGREDAVWYLSASDPATPVKPTIDSMISRAIEVDDVEGVIRGVSHVQPPQAAVDGGVIESAVASMLGEVDVALEGEGSPISRR